MLGYCYDNNLFESHVEELDESPREPGSYLIPGRCSLSPFLEKGQYQINKYRPDFDDWELVPDYSGVIFYSKTDKTTITYNIEETPDFINYTTIAPPNPAKYYQWNETLEDWEYIEALEITDKRAIGKLKAKELEQARADAGFDFEIAPGNSKKFDCDTKATIYVGNLTNLARIKPDFAIQAFSDYDNILHSLSNAQLKSLGAGLLAKKQADFTEKHNYYSAIDAEPTLSGLNAIIAEIQSKIDSL